MNFAQSYDMIQESSQESLELQVAIYSTLLCMGPLQLENLPIAAELIRLYQEMELEGASEGHGDIDAMSLQQVIQHLYNPEDRSQVLLDFAIEMFRVEFQAKMPEGGQVFINNQPDHLQGKVVCDLQTLGFEV